MGIVHALAEFGKGGLTGFQAGQRDWSPYLVHFTSFGAMAPLRNWQQNAKPNLPKRIGQLLKIADQQSLAVATQIINSGHLRASSPSDKNQIPSCVCLSECNLPGLFGHSERYGRFGFVFSKLDVFKLGGRPCVYVDRQVYGNISASGKQQPISSPAGLLFGLANVLSPTGAGAKVQDYTHEREWRIFANLAFETAPIRALLCPQVHLQSMQSLAPGIPVLPLDVLVEWGA